MKYQPRITKQNNGFYALIVRVDADGTENVIFGYKAKHFASRKAAEKSTLNHIAKFCLR